MEGFGKEWKEMFEGKRKCKPVFKVQLFYKLVENIKDCQCDETVPLTFYNAINIRAINNDDAIKVNVKVIDIFTILEVDIKNIAIAFNTDGIIQKTN